jgi:hypothetical protein
VLLREFRAGKEDPIHRNGQPRKRGGN